MCLKEFFNRPTNVSTHALIKFIKISTLFSEKIKLTIINQCLVPSCQNYIVNSWFNGPSSLITFKAYFRLIANHSYQD